MTWAIVSGSADRLAVRHPRTQTETNDAGEYTCGRDNYVSCLVEPSAKLEAVEYVVYAVSLAAANSRNVKQ
jgi:hypothetical protein